MKIDSSRIEYAFQQVCLLINTPPNGLRLMVAIDLSAALF